MNAPETEKHDESRWADHSIELALIFLLLGGSFLASARLLGFAATRLPLASIAEFLGWGSLASTTAVLFSRLRHGREYHSRRDLERRFLARPKYKGWQRGRRISVMAPAGREDSERAKTIEKLYTELRPLMSRAAADPSLKEEVQVKLAHLRRLQGEEADEMEKRFEAGLLLKSGEGWQALERADELLARYESPSSPDAPAERKN